MKQTLEPMEAGELASALADGELHDVQLALALATLQAQPQAQQRWHDYHLVGDLLRHGSAAAVQPHDPAFVRRLRERLQTQDSVAMPVAGPVHLPRGQSANDGVWRWKLVAGLSAFTMLALLGWQLTAPPQGASLAQVSPQAVPGVPDARVAETPGPVMLRDPRLDQLIQAHQHSGGASVLQVPAGFLRNATFERPAR